MLKLKAFIYRFSNIFGLSIYLANKEENAYIESQSFDSGLSTSLAIGLWQAKNGFTTVWVYRETFINKTIQRIKHTFALFGETNEKP